VIWLVAIYRESKRNEEFVLATNRFDVGESPLSFLKNMFEAKPSASGIRSIYMRRLLALSLFFTTYVPIFGLLAIGFDSVLGRMESRNLASYLLLAVTAVFSAGISFWSSRSKLAKNLLKIPAVRFVVIAVLAVVALIVLLFLLVIFLMSRQSGSYYIG
jgi:hypothetical protein